MPWEFYDTFDENDRRRALAQAEYTSKSGATIDLRASGDVGALPLKYGIDPEATGTWAGNDKVLDRYAEVLLFKAEALNELNGPNPVSYTHLIIFAVGGIDIRVSIHTTSIFCSHRIITMPHSVANIRPGRQFQPEHIFYKIKTVSYTHL